MSAPAAPVRTTLVDLLREPPPTAGSAAVVDADESVRWPDAVDRVARLAGALRATGVKRGDTVGVQLETSARTMVAVHAVLRLGAVVVPVDPRAPAPRAAEVLETCDVAVLVTDASPTRLAALTEHLTPRAVVAVHEQAGDALPDATHLVSWGEAMVHDPAPAAAVRPDDAAYVISTSGSTGRPKGIVHTHRSGLAYAQLAVATYDLAPDDRVATLSPLHFDQSTFSLYAAPLAGAAAVQLPDTVLRLPASAAAMLAELRATVWYGVPSLFVSLLRRGALERHDLRSVRWVLFGGEVFPSPLLAELMTSMPDARWSNVYGPAEVNQCTYHHVVAPPPSDAPIPIGTSWEDTELLVVGENGQQVADGDAGELWVRSTTAMLGYWDDLASTAAVLVHRPGDEPGRPPWYRTGDLVAARSDGELVFLGRVDNQVKVRGHRVEPEAVEAVLAAIAGVEEVAVVAAPADDGGVELVAVLGGTPAVHDVDLLRAARRELAAHLVPGRVARVVRIPRTSTGKIDRPSTLELLRRAAAEER